MKRITAITLFALVLVGLVGLASVLPGLRPLAELTASPQAAGDPNTLILEAACDCRTGSKGFFSGSREDVFIVSGKLFPAGTLPSGNGSNDPTKPVNGVAPIGEWTCRGQHAFPFPPEIAPAYSSSSPVFNTQYFILNDGRALTVEGYVKPDFSGELMSVTGGIGGFSGAAGFIEEATFGTNATGCPNFRAVFHFRPGSLQNSGSNQVTSRN